MQGLSMILWRSLKNTRLQKFIRKQPIVSARNWALSQPMILPSQSELLAACRGYQTGRRLGNRRGQCFEMLWKMNDFHASHFVLFVSRLCTRTSALLRCDRHGALQHSKGFKRFFMFLTGRFTRINKQIHQTDLMVTLEVLICIRRSILWPSSSRFGCTSTKETRLVRYRKLSQTGKMPELHGYTVCVCVSLSAQVIGLYRHTHTHTYTRKMGRVIVDTAGVFAILLPHLWLCLSRALKVCLAMVVSHARQGFLCPSQEIWAGFFCLMFSGSSQSSLPFWQVALKYMRSINAGVQRQIQQEVRCTTCLKKAFQMSLCLDKKRGLILYKTTYSFSFLKHFEAHVRQGRNFSMLCDACFSSHRTQF